MTTRYRNGEPYEEEDELLREALEVLDNARCKLTDPTLRVQWGVRKNRLMAKLRERLGN